MKYGPSVCDFLCFNSLQTENGITRWHNWEPSHILLETVKAIN